MQKHSLAQFTFAIVLMALSSMAISAEQATDSRHLPVQQPADALNVANKHSPQLEELLDRWEEACSKLEHPSGDFSRSEFNHAFAVEKVATGKFVIGTVNNWKIQLIPVKLKQSQVSKRVTRDGERFSIRSIETGMRMICTSDSLVWVNDKEKSDYKDVIPENDRGSDRIGPPVSFQLFVSPRKTISDFKLSVFYEDDEKIMILAISQRKHTDRQSLLEALENLRPSNFVGNNADDYLKAAITLSKKTYLPAEVRLLGQSKIEIVYRFENVSSTSDDELPSELTPPGYREIIPSK